MFAARLSGIVPTRARHREGTFRPATAAFAVLATVAALLVAGEAPAPAAGGGTISTVAGNGTPGSGGDGGPATAAQLNDPYHLAFDSVGNLYIADNQNFSVRKVDTAGIMTTVAGNGTQGFSGDGGPATAAQLNESAGVALDAGNNLFISEPSGHRIRRVDAATGIISTVAGTGTAGFSGDGGAATAARLASPRGIKFDSAGNLFVSDLGNARVRKIDTSGVISTLAGNGSFGFAGDGGQATLATLSSVQDVAVDGAGNLYIADQDNNRVRRVEPSGIITTFAGTGGGGSSGDGGAATSAELGSPIGLALRGGEVFVSEFGGGRVRKVDSSGIIGTVAGGGSPPDGLGDGLAATDARLIQPLGLAFSPTGALHISDLGHRRIRAVEIGSDSLGSATIVTIAGNGTHGSGGDGGPATAAQLNDPYQMTFDSAGNLYFADNQNFSVRKVDTAGIITTVAGNGTQGFSGDGGPATAAQLNESAGVALDAGNNLFISEPGGNRIRRVDAATGIISTVAGTGSSGFSGDGGLATAAKLASPRGIDFDSAGNLFIADINNSRIRKIDTSGIISTVAGSGGFTYGGDGGSATAAKINGPQDVAVDSSGNLFIADQGNNRVRRVDAGGIITTVAGNGGGGFSGDGGPGTAAELAGPIGLALKDGNLYISDFGNGRVRMVDAGGIISTVAGGGSPPDGLGDGLAATDASLSLPLGLAFSPTGALYIADLGHLRIRAVAAPATGSEPIVTVVGNGTRGAGGDGGPAASSTLVSVEDSLPAGVTFVDAIPSQGSCSHTAGVVTCSLGLVGGGSAASVTILVTANQVGSLSNTATATSSEIDPFLDNNTAVSDTTVTDDPTIIYTVAGNGNRGGGGDGGPAVDAELNDPYRFAFDSAGNMYIVVNQSHTVRRVDAATGVITTVAGNGSRGHGGDGGPATSAQLRDPAGVAIDAQGNLFVSEHGNHLVRRVDASTGIITTVVGACDRSFFVCFGGYDPGSENVPATSIHLSSPRGMNFDASGALVIAELNNGLIRRVVPGSDGIITGASDELISTVAGTRAHCPNDFGCGGFSGDGGPATSAEISAPQDVAFDNAGNMFIALEGNARVRRVDAATSIISTIAGGGSPADGVGDGLAATEAAIAPVGVMTDSAGNVFIADFTGRVRRVDAATGVIGTVAGGGNPPDGLGDGLPATQASLRPLGIGFASTGELYISDLQHQRIRATNIQADVLALSKTDSPDPAVVGQPFQYALEVTNTSDGTATGVTITDPLPAGVALNTAVTSQGTCSEAGGTVTCALGDLAADASATVTLNVTPSAAGMTINTATVVANEAELQANNSASSETLVQDPNLLSITDAVTTSYPTVGEPLTHVITVSNHYTIGVATGVTVTDTLPVNASFVSATPSQGTCDDPAGGAVICHLGNLAAQGTATVTLVVTPNVAEPSSNTATVAANEPDPAPGDNSAPTDIPVSGAGCGRLISQHTTLTADIGPCRFDGLTVTTDGVRLDLGGHRVFGFPGTETGDTIGIRVPFRKNVTVKNGTVSDFDAGVFIDHGDHNTVRNIVARDNMGKPNVLATEFGDGIVAFSSEGNKILNNTVINNGPWNGIGIFDPGSHGNLIQNNLVLDNFGSDDGGPSGQGIIVNGADDGRSGTVVHNNSILNNVVRGSGGPGISTVNTVNSEIIGNTVEDNGFENNNGNGIAVTTGPVAQTRVTSALIEGNEIHGNAENGILITATNFGSSFSQDNEIIDNDAAGNAIREGFDLFDRSPTCETNTWSGNTWGSGGFSSVCTTAGGSTTPPVLAVFRPSTGDWFVRHGATTNFGTAGDIAVPADYNGDDQTELAVFRPSTGIWYVQGGATTAWGTNGDIPVPADFDGDGDADLAVFRPSIGAWFVHGGASTPWGTDGDIPVAADYDGDGRADVAVYRPSTGTWYVQNGSSTAWGTSGDVPAPADYDGDGDTDLAVYRPSIGVWFVRGGPTLWWGTNGDIPVPADYDGDGHIDAAVFRPSTNVWYVFGGESAAFGGPGDDPLPLAAAIRETYFP